MITIFTTPDIKALNSQARYRKLNRQLSDNFVNILDPDGVHLLVNQWIHNDDHWRLELMLKGVNSDQPLIAFIDATSDNFHLYSHTLSEQQLKQITKEPA